MNPNEPNYSVDYLNQIAPQAPKRTGFSRLQYIVIGIVAVVVVLTIFLGISVTSKGGTAPEKQLAARLQGTEIIVSNAQRTIKSSQLRSLNSNLAIYLTNTNRDIAVPLLAAKVDVTKLDKKLVASEAGTDMSSRLEDARLLATFDATYAREISYQLETIVALMRQIYGSTRSASLKTFLDNAFTNLEPTQKQFAEFNAANG